MAQVVADLPPLCRTADEGHYLASAYLLRPSVSASVLWHTLLEFLHERPLTEVSCRPDRAVLYAVAWAPWPDIEFCKVTLSFFVDVEAPQQYVLEYHRLSGDGTGPLACDLFHQVCAMLVAKAWLPADHPLPTARFQTMVSEEPDDDIPLLVDNDDESCCRLDITTWAQHLQSVTEEDTRTHMLVGLVCGQRRLGTTHETLLPLLHNLPWDQLLPWCFASHHYREQVALAILLALQPGLLSLDQLREHVTRVRHGPQAHEEEPFSAHDAAQERAFDEMLLRRPLSLWQALGL